MTNWRYVGHGAEGDEMEISGVRVWSHQWTCHEGERAEVTDPIHGQRYSFPVYRIVADGQQITFAAGEFSNSVYGFYMPAP